MAPLAIFHMNSRRKWGKETGRKEKRRRKEKKRKEREGKEGSRDGGEAGKQELAPYYPFPFSPPHQPPVL